MAVMHYIPNYLLTWEANWFAASQEIPRISRNPKVHYRTHKRPPPIYPGPAHIPTSYLLEIHPNSINPSTPRSPQWSLSLRFPHQDPIHPSPHPYAPHAQPISFFSILSPAQYWVRGTVQILQLLVMQSPPFLRYLVPPRSKYSPVIVLFILINVRCRKVTLILGKNEITCCH